MSDVSRQMMMYDAQKRASSSRFSCGFFSAILALTAFMGARR